MYKKDFSFRGLCPPDPPPEALPPHQRLCLWTPLRALPQTPI